MPAVQSPTVSVTMTPLQSNHPSIHSDLETEPSLDREEITGVVPPGEIVTHDINRLLQYLHEVDQIRGGDNLDLAEQMQRIEDELNGLFDFVGSQEDEPVMRTPSPIYVEVPVPYPVHPPPALSTPIEFPTPLAAPSTQFPQLSPAQMPLPSPATMPFPSPLRPPSPFIAPSVRSSIVMRDEPHARSPSGMAAPTVTSAQSSGTATPSSATLSVDPSSPHVVVHGSPAPQSIMSVTEDQGDVIIHRTPPVAAPSPALPPLRLSSASSLTPSVEWISTPRTDSIVLQAPPGSPRTSAFRFSQALSSGTSLPSLPSMPISSPTEASTLPPSSPSIPSAPVPTEASPSPSPPPASGPFAFPPTPAFPSVPSGVPRDLSPAPTVHLGPNNRELQDAINDLHNLAERLMEQQLRTNDAIDDLKNRPPPSPIRFPMPVPAPPSPIVQPPPRMLVERPVSAIEIPPTIQMPIPEPYQPSYADVLTNIADALQDIVNTGNRPPEVEVEPQVHHELEESSQSDISEALSSTTGTTLRRDMFDRMRSGILGPHTVPSDESLRTAVPQAVFTDAPSRRADPSIALDRAPSFRPTVRRPVPRRLMRSPSPDWIRPRSVPLPEVAHPLPPWQPPVELRTIPRRRISVPVSVPVSELSDSAPSTEGIPVDLDLESMATESEAETEIGEEKREQEGTEPPQEQRLADESDTGIDMEKAVRHVRRHRGMGGDGFYRASQPTVCIIHISCMAS